jgi:nucleoside-diphosphate-sugar epimerase
VVIARESNPVGPGMGDHLLCGTVARQVVAIEQGRQAPVLELRDLTPVRDFLHVDDAAAAIWHLALHGAPGEAYNVAAGHSIVVREMVEAFLGLSLVPGIAVRSSRTDAARSPLHEQYLDVRKIAATGWRAERGWRQGAADLLHAVRESESPARGAR